MEKILIEYRQWLSLKFKSKGVISTQIARINRIAKSYDVLNEYVSDHCANLIELFTYTRADQRAGEALKAEIVIEGDYYKGMASLKHALTLFVSFLESIRYTASVKKSKSVFSGTFDDFKRFIGPKCRNEVNAFCKPERTKHNGICEYCGQSSVLESAHIVERPIIMKAILDANYKKGSDYYEVELDDFFERFREDHMPVKDHIFFLCKKCHAALDKAKKLTVADIRAKRGY